MTTDPNCQQGDYHKRQKRHSKSNKQWYYCMTIPRIYFAGCNGKMLFRLKCAKNRLTEHSSFLKKRTKTQKVKQSTTTALSKTTCSLQGINQMQDKSRKVKFYNDQLDNAIRC
ncbi:hypothetical protein EUGRSUZ_L03267 [Eucalyptus grandis]|uniref:Uncharacterized protein n=1 Tax=Eucalyptus grandis TaxID=71139 RepID=A0AAD9T926_EUCGR|nr:hypothetical protein EUGRSUZ_L03267 [Eucalyptus grandis]